MERIHVFVNPPSAPGHLPAKTSFLFVNDVLGRPTIRPQVRPCRPALQAVRRHGVKENTAVAER